MANSKQARKRARQSTVRNQQNTAQRSKLRTAIRSVRKAIAAGDKNKAMEVLQKSTSVIDSIADKKIVHKNLAARNKSRLATAIKAMA
jgi:small subunit ribosomal protein S20